MPNSFRAVALLGWVAFVGLPGTGFAKLGADISTVSPQNLRPDTLPSSVPGVVHRGQSVQEVRLSLKDKAGLLRREAIPVVAVLRTVAWSPEDAARDGASEFEVLVCAARLIDQRALAGIVSIGNRNGAFLPSAEQAFQRIVSMGLPVVRLASGSTALAPTQDDLIIEGGSLSPDDARQVLAECLLRHGALPPAANPNAPTASEREAIRQRLLVYQAEFDLRAAPRVASR